MNSNGHSDDNLPNGIGEELGQEAFEHAKIHGEDYCLRERQRIEVANEPATLALRARIALRQAEADELEEQIRNAPPEGDVRTRRNRARFYMAIAVILLVGIFLYTVMALQPFRIGWIMWGLVLACAIATPFLCDETLEVWDTTRHRLGYKVFLTVVCFAAIAGQLLLGVVRGYVFQEQLTNNTAPVVIEGESRADTVPTFYHKATGCLMLALPNTHDADLCHAYGIGVPGKSCLCRRSSELSGGGGPERLGCCRKRAGRNKRTPAESRRGIQHPGYRPGGVEDDGDRHYRSKLQSAIGAAVRQDQFG
jgi:hypothetical protein